jgi:hypothetical protein
MTDIVARLRSWVKNEVQEPDPASVILVAADEIDRLRRLVPPIAGTVNAETGMDFIPWSVAASFCQAADVSQRVDVLPQGFGMRRLSPWIPVGERLPESGDCVWGFDGDEPFLCEYLGGSFQTYGASCDREGLNSETLVGISHWSPLVCPEKPA